MRAQSHYTSRWTRADDNKLERSALFGHAFILQMEIRDAALHDDTYLHTLFEWKVSSNIKLINISLSPRERKPNKQIFERKKASTVLANILS